MKNSIFALDNARFVRNIKSVRKKKPIKYDIPFMAAISNEYLVILMLEIILSCGELFEE